MSRKKAEYKSHKSISVPISFDEAMKRLMRVKPPPDGNYKAANERRARKKSKR